MALDRSKMQAYAARVARQVSRQQSAAAAQEAADNAELYKQVKALLSKADSRARV